MAPQHRLYTAELAETILERIADGEGLATICASPGMPSRGAVQHWVTTDHDGFASRYARARVAGLMIMADDIVVIADEAKDVDSAAAARVRVEARKWILSKLLPKQFGDRMDLNMSGELDIKRVPEAALDDRLRVLLAMQTRVALPSVIEGKAEPENDE